MPGIRWSPERRAFLRERIPGYKRAQEEKRVAEYKKKIIKEYFDAYPQPDEKQVEKETKVCTSESVLSFRDLMVCTRG